MGFIFLFIWHYLGDPGFSARYSMNWDSFKVGKKWKKVWQAGPSCLF